MNSGTFVKVHTWILVSVVCALVASLAGLPAHGAERAEVPPDKEKPADPLQVGTIWKGKLTQRGKHPDVAELPPEIKNTVKVTKRDGENVELEMKGEDGDGNWTYLCKGTVKYAAEGTYELTFESYALKDAAKGAVTVTKVPYQAKVKGTSMKGTWKYPKNDKGIELEGEFDFTKQ